MPELMTVPPVAGAGRLVPRCSVVIPDGGLVIIHATRPLRLGLREREEFEAAYKQALTTVEASDGR